MVSINNLNKTNPMIILGGAANIENNVNGRAASAEIINLNSPQPQNNYPVRTSAGLLDVLRKELAEKSYYGRWFSNSIC